MKIRSLQRHLASVRRMKLGPSHRGLRARLELVSERSLGVGTFLWHTLDRAADLDAPLLHHLPRGGGEQDVRTYSLADLRDATERYARWFHAAGVARGDRVGVYSGDGIANFVHFMALNSIGAIPAPVNPNMAPQTAARYLKRLEPRGVVADADRLETLLAAADGPEGLGFTVSQEEVEGAGRVGPLPVGYPYMHGDHDPVLIAHSSGTTGMPKAPILGHRQFFAGKRPRILTMPSGLDDKNLLVFPPSHGSGLSYMMMATLTGVPTLVMEEQRGPAVAEVMRWWRPTVVIAFPITFGELAAQGVEPSAAARVTTWLSTADASHEAHVRELVRLGRHRVGGKWRQGSRYIDGLASTEVGMAVFQNIHGPDTDAYKRCVGHPEPIVEEATVYDEHGKRLGPNEIGFIAVKTPTETLGYWNDPDLTHRSKHDGFWLTGDIGYYDEQGRFYQYDRATDVIHTARGPVYSLPTEEIVLKACREAVDCVVAAAISPDDEELSEPVAVVRLTERSRLTSRELLTRLNGALRKAGTHEVSAVVLVRGENDIPLGVTGKVLKREVRATYEKVLLSDDDHGLDIARTRSERTAPSSPAAAARRRPAKAA
ncbi:MULTISPECIES: class I adenylate-forming enzyme family protein [Streptomyces]|uniref:class I adenylate-forming enzyme family protein n=1 Tax=Streptomyces TaxID=1883 RepID=UPI000698636D|nr:class I adenylate-forming enzyme family protein [Streptomyces sp. FxanaA7]